MSVFGRFRRARTAVVALVGLLVFTVGGCAQPSWKSSLVSVNASGSNSGNGTSYDSVFSPDGTKIAFTSSASNLGPTDANGVDDVYLRDLTTGTTTLVSANGTGNNSGNSRSENPVFSPDGTKIAFRSMASNLGPLDSNETSDVYLRDLSTGTTTLVSVNSAGNNSGNGHSWKPVYSPDGHKIAFESYATNFGPTDTSMCDDGNPNGPYNCQDLYVRDLTTGTTDLVSVDAAGTNSGDGWSRDAVFSADSASIAFDTMAGNLGAGDANANWDVYVRNLTVPATYLVSVNAAGTDGGNDYSVLPVWSPDGNKIAYMSAASDLGPVDEPDDRDQDVYLRDLATGTTSLVSTNVDGTDGGNAHSLDPRFSPDSNQIAFLSSATDLGFPDDNGYYGGDVFIRNLTTGTLTLVSVNAAGTGTGNARSYGPQFDPSGHRLLFVSAASDLVANDTNDKVDVYVRDLQGNTTTVVSANADNSNGGNGDSEYVIFRPAWSPDGSKIAFTSLASDFGPTDSNGNPDVYVAGAR
jgi:Tol biopolymer transport system component